MNTFFSIAYSNIRPARQERLSVALFIGDGNQFLYRYSPNKVEVLSKLLPKEAHQLLKANLKAMSEFVENRNANAILQNTPARLLSESYFQYLSKYSNNLISFSEPQPIDVELNEESFDLLFSKFVNDSDKKIAPHEKELVLRVRKKVDPQIKQHVNLDIELNTAHISTLEVPTPVWFIGQNEVKVTGETIDFDKQYHSVRNDLHGYMYLIDRMEHAGHKYAQHFLVGKEPDKANEQNHKLWSEIRKSKELVFTNESETDSISDYIQEHGVTPFVVG